MMLLNPYGKIVQSCWQDIPNHYPNILLDSFIIMPNHIHGIIIINNPCRGGFETRLYETSSFGNHTGI